MLSSLLALFPENASYLYETLDYPSAMDLVESVGNAKISIEDKDQSLNNSAFLDMLLKLKNKKLKWRNRQDQDLYNIYKTCLNQK